MTMPGTMPSKLNYERPPERQWSGWWIAAVVIVVFLVLAATVLVA
jgi:hypothetical protein